MKKKILIATTNPGKLSEISEMLDFDIDWKSLADFPDIEEIEENGKTFTENARKKALGYANQTGLWTLADDSGLVVDVLGGLPGVKSARFSGGKEKDRKLLDHKNMAKLLGLLKDIPKEKRTAKFVCCLCLACPEPVEGASQQEILIETEGKLEGVIAEKETGTGGFGYDPIFFVPQLNKTVAQLMLQEKNTISHRGNAVIKLKPLLNRLLTSIEDI
jgi:XTP/dITP diphosphohydrolase